MVSIPGENFGSKDNKTIDISVLGFEEEARSSMPGRSSSLTFWDRSGNSFIEAFMIVGVRVNHPIPK